MIQQLIVPTHDAIPMEGRIDWAARIRSTWGSALQAILDTGQALIEAKAALEHGEFIAMVEENLPFARSTAFKLMKIAEDKRLSNVSHVKHLPPSWGTLYQLTRLDDATFITAVETGAIRPDMERKDAERLRTAEWRGERLARTEELSKASPPAITLTAAARRYPVIYADPPWRFKTYSDLGKEKSPENHYPTMTSEELLKLPIDTLAAEAAALCLWATVGHLGDALALMTHWGFAYRSHVIWRKTNADGSQHRGTGYWFVNVHELLLIGIRGDMPAPLPGTQEESVISAPVGRHSEKPARFRDLIERYFPAVGKIELFARPPLPAGWDCWGNEVREPPARLQESEAA